MQQLESIEKEIQELKKRIEELGEGVQEDKLSMIVFSGDMDKLLASFIIATGAAAMGMKVSMFFTFWGIAALRKENASPRKKDFMSKMFHYMLPRGANRVKLSKMNMGGMGTMMLKNLMKKKNVQSLSQLIEIAAELEVKIYICNMSMELMGFGPEDMIDYPGLEYAGVATYLAEAQESKIQLFI